MAAPKVQFVPVQAPKGQRVHATSLAIPIKTACGRGFEGGWKVSPGGHGWAVVMRRVNCRQCKLAMVHDARPKKRRRRS